jgi:hypothetical protein
MFGAEYQDKCFNEWWVGYGFNKIAAFESCKGDFKDRFCGYYGPDFFPTPPTEDIEPAISAPHCTRDRDCFVFFSTFFYFF